MSLEGGLSPSSSVVVFCFVLVDRDGGLSSSETELASFFCRVLVDLDAGLSSSDTELASFVCRVLVDLDEGLSSSETMLAFCLSIGELDELASSAELGLGS